jgi:membrane protease YdiL (CAAX protease family)
VASEPDRGELLRRAIAAAAWLTFMLGVGPLATALTPAEARAKVAYQTFLMASQITILVLGLGATLLLVRRRREALGVTWPGAGKIAGTALAAPLAFVASSYIALQIALPTLLEELRTRGAGASQQNAGAFGQALTKPPLLVVLLWGALLAALSEELFFRGLFWTTITDLTTRLGTKLGVAPPPPPGADTTPRPSVDNEHPSPLAAYTSAPTQYSAPPPSAPSVRARALSIVLHGGIATLLSAALFGYMHKDLPGGVGIVRLWSTTCLGLASGVVRQTTRSVIACVLLHALYNTIVIGSGRRWFSSPKEEPVLEGVPNTLVLLAVLGLCAIGLIAFIGALRARRARSVLLDEPG